MSLLGVDIGTSSCKAMAIDCNGRELAMSRATYRRQSPEAGWCEIAPYELASAVDHVIADVAARTRLDPVTAMCFSVFGGSFVPLDSDNRPLYNIIGTTDVRAIEDAETWLRRFSKEDTYRIVGLVPHPSFPLLKAIAMKRLYPDIYRRAAKLVTTYEFILAHLGLTPTSDRATVSTYMAYDLTRADWSQEIVDACGVDRSLLPDVVDCGSIIGALEQSTAERLGLVGMVSVVAGGHDQQMAGFGAGLTDIGLATNSLGTVDCISTLLASPRPDGAFLKNNLPNFCHVWDKLFFTCAYNFSCADLLNWAMRVFYGATRGNETPYLQDGLANLPSRPSQKLVLPHFCGSGTPYMDASSRGAVVGLDFNTTREEVLRAIVDSQNYEMRLNLDVWREVGLDVNRLRVYGGLAQSDTVLQIKSDILGVEVAKLQCHEAGCLGAAVLAGWGTGKINDPVAVIEQSACETRVFAPRTEWAELHEEMYGIYKQLYPAVRDINGLMVGLPD